jgi:cell fate (sporulation/competence/biofilm development) regulator YlbF (YheA/YmcA/DUF963 family)
LNKVPVVEVAQLGDDWRQQISALETFNYLLDAKNQLLDVMRATMLATRYGKMRKQFKTLDEDTTSERRIIEY